MKKRIFSMLIAICTVFSLMPVSAMADTSSIGSGTSNIGSGTSDILDGVTPPVTSPMRSVPGVALAAGSPFTANITVGNNTDVPCSFKVLAAPDVDGSGGTVEIVNGNRESAIGEATAGKLEIPTTVSDGTNSYTVTAIGNYAFSACSKLTGDLTIPTGVTTIGNYAFSQCSKLTGDLTIPTGVTTIGIHAFSECTGFVGKLTIPNTVKTIDNYAFSKCSGLTGDLTIPTGVETIGEGAFWGCSGFTGTLIIPADIETIYGSAFDGCSGLTGTLTIPTSVTSIGGSAFEGCHGFTGTLTIPAGVTSIGGSAFEGCSGFTGTLAIPAGVETIGGSAFKGCSGFTGTLAIPAGLTTIDYYTFDGCSGFTGTLIIPADIETIYDSAFANCSGLDIVIFRNATPPIVGENVFDGASLSVIYVPTGTSTVYKDTENLTEFADIIRELLASAASPTFTTDLMTEETTYTVGVNAAPLTVAANASDGGTISYQWYSTTSPTDTTNGTKIDGETGTTYIPPTSIAGTKYYYCAVTNSYIMATTDTTVTSAVATITVKVATPTVPVEAVALSKAALSLYSNAGTKTETLTAVVAPENATNKAVTWASSNTSVATVAKGTVTAVGNGTATITVTTADGGKAATCVVTVSTYTDNSGSGSSGGSSSGSSPIAPPPTNSAQVETKVESKVDTNGNLTVNVKAKDITDAIAKAETTANGITIVLNASGSGTGNSVNVNLPKVVQEAILNNQIGNTIVVVDNPNVQIGMDLSTIKEINAQAKADVNLTATRMDSGKLTGNAKTAIGIRPAFEIQATYGGGKQIRTFGTGRVSIAIPYTLGADEKAGNVCAVYVDENGNVQWLTGSVYDSAAKLLRFSTNHFSTYGVGYRAADAAFSDTANHFAKNDIDFVVGRGLFAVTDTNDFSPDTPITRGMFVTALGRLSDIDSTKYKNAKFTDVVTTAYYAPYVAWAAEKNITTSTTPTTFAPQQTIARQEMASIMQSYAVAMGYTVPKAREAVIFVDRANIASRSSEAVQAMQQAGIIMGKDGNRFDPTGAATVAEASAVLRRYMELVIDTRTAQGWETNDSGSALYYQDGRPLIGSKVVDGTVYSFNSFGETSLLAGVQSQQQAMHTVEPNEYFGVIAQQHGCTVADLMELNGKQYGDVIHPGDMLKLPQKQ